MTSMAPLGARSPEEINDMAQVIEVVTVYGKAMDRRNWDVYGFEDGLDLRYPEWAGGHGGPIAADTWGEMARGALIGFTGTQQDITTVRWSSQARTPKFSRSADTTVSE